MMEEKLGRSRYLLGDRYVGCSYMPPLCSVNHRHIMLGVKLTRCCCSRLLRASLAVSLVVSHVVSFVVSLVVTLIVGLGTWLKDRCRL